MRSVSRDSAAHTRKDEVVTKRADTARVGVSAAEYFMMEVYHVSKKPRPGT